MSEENVIEAVTDTPVENNIVVAIAEQPVKPKRLIGSQRNPEAYRPKPTIPVESPEVTPPPAPQTETYPPSGVIPPPKPADDAPEDEYPGHLSEEGIQKLKNVPLRPMHVIGVPKLRNGRMTDDLEAEFDAVFGSNNAAIDALLRQSGESAVGEILEPETKIKAKVMSVQGDSVFLDVGAREQGVVLLKMFPPEEEPRVGQELEVTVIRFLKAEGLYEVSVPLAAADVRDWAQVQVGMIVEALITKTNNGGLECEVNRLRGFIPISQIELFRVEDTASYVGKKLTCVVEEVNVERRNLVLSRKAMLLREREEKRTQLLGELEVGQEREGLVRKIIDAGAFVDLGGVDGFVPIGAMSWGRIRHPSDVLTEGTRIKVRIANISEGGSRISLVYRDDASNPWSNITERFQEKTLARGKVTKTTDFGAFVELMPGVEGLVHISELANKRVANVREITKEGEWVDVYIVSIDTENRKMSLSMKQAAAQNAPPPDLAGTPGEEAEEVEVAPVKPKNTYKGPLKGGIESSSGRKHGLKW